MNIKQQIEKLTSSIQRVHSDGHFPNYIDYIRFPFFKNLKANSRIDFEFPFTVFTGPNGSGKSSALHAMYGSPEGYSVADFWFSTPLDPINTNRKRGEIPSIIYSYKLGGKPVEVIKRRTGVSKGLDYWEPSRPISLYGMKRVEGGKRNPTLKKAVKFLDFRSELSAFDKYFHFGLLKRGKTINSKQDYLRRYAKYVKEGFKPGHKVQVYSRTCQDPLGYGTTGTKILSNILGKSYSYCSLLIHNFYGFEGATIMFTSNNKIYSEAFAGRGEFAVAKLVYEIISAEEGSLIILDEPEVSLHPSAQEKLKLFLLEYCLKKKLQIIISTHSPKLVEFLPNEAIKLFYEENDGKFNILNNCSYFEAFHKLGETINSSDKKVIIVEDKTAKNILDVIITEIGRDFPLLFEVTFYPGGADNIYKSSVAYSQEDEKNKYIILDGDQRKPSIDPSKFTAKELLDLDFLNTRLEEITGSNFKNLGFRIDGNQRGNKDQKMEFILSYIKYTYTNVDYLPLHTPEEIIWNEGYANNLLSVDGKTMPEDITDFKLKFSAFSELFFGDSKGPTIDSAHKKFIQHFIDNKDANYHKIKKMIEKFHG